MPVRGSGPLTWLWRYASRSRVRRPALLLALAVGVGLAPQVVQAGALRLSWTDNSEGEAGLRIERKTGTGGAYSELSLVGPGSTSFADTSIIEGVTYCYRVQAYNGIVVSDYSNEACGTSATSLAVTVSLN